MGDNKMVNLSEIGYSRRTSPDGLNREAGALFLIRIALAYFFMVWGINKLLTADQTTKLFDYFYALSLPATAPYALGLAEAVLALAIAVGLWRRPIYLIALLVHSVTILVTIGSLATPFRIEDGFPVNRMYAASVPTWGALVALYLLRDRDRWSLEGLRRGL